MGETIRVHDRTSGAYGTTDCRSVNLEGTKIDIWNSDSKTSTMPNQVPTLELNTYKYGLMEEIAAMSGDKETLTEDDFLEFRTKYESDSNFKSNIDKKYNVTGVISGENGVTTIGFKYHGDVTEFKIDFETKAEKAAKDEKIRVAQEAQNKEKVEEETQKNPEKDDSRKENTTGWKDVWNGIKAFLYDRWLRH